MTVLFAFALGFAFSFVGSIPPGTLNLIVFQLGLNNKIRVAMRFTAAVALIEYPYAWLAVKFADYITSAPAIVDNMKLISAIVMILIGVLSLLPAKQQTSPAMEQFNNSGFRRGVVLSILNPMAIPFWVGVTAYLTGQGYLDLSTNWHLQSYLIGICLGSVALLVMFAYLAQKIVDRIGDLGKLSKLPGYIILGLGLYALADYLWL